MSISRQWDAAARQAGSGFLLGIASSLLPIDRDALRSIEMQERIVAWFEIATGSRTLAEEMAALCTDLGYTTISSRSDWLRWTRRFLADHQQDGRLAIHALRLYRDHLAALGFVGMGLEGIVSIRAANIIVNVRIDTGPATQAIREAAAALGRFGREMRRSNRRIRRAQRRALRSIAATAPSLAYDGRYHRPADLLEEVHRINAGNRRRQARRRHRHA